MKSRAMRRIAILTALAGALAGSAVSAQDKYAQKVPGGLAFSEFRGYESWQVVSISQDGPLMAAILANPVMIKAYQAGVPGNGKPFPDGSKMAKIHWTPTKMKTFPAATVPGAQHDVDFMVRDSKRFSDSGNWGWAVFEYDSRVARLQAGHVEGHAAAGERRQVRVRLPHHREVERLRLHGLRGALNQRRSNRIGAAAACVAVCARSPPPWPGRPPGWEPSPSSRPCAGRSPRRPRRPPPSSTGPPTTRPASSSSRRTVTRSGRRGSSSGRRTIRSTRAGSPPSPIPWAGRSPCSGRPSGRIRGSGCAIARWCSTSAPTASSPTPAAGARSSCRCAACGSGTPHSCTKPRTSCWPAPFRSIRSRPATACARSARVTGSISG